MSVSVTLTLVCGVYLSLDERTWDWLRQSRIQSPNEPITITNSRSIRGNKLTAWICTSVIHGNVIHWVIHTLRMSSVWIWPSDFWIIPLPSHLKVEQGILDTPLSIPAIWVHISLSDTDSIGHFSSNTNSIGNFSSNTDSIRHFIWVQIRIRLFQRCISGVNCCRYFFQWLLEPLHRFHCFRFVLVLYLEQ